MNPEKLPVPLPPEPESPKGIIALLQHHRFILATLVILLFFGLLFGLGFYRQGQTDGAPSDAAPPTATESPESFQAKAPEPLQPPAPEALTVPGPEPGPAKLPDVTEPFVPESTPSAKSGPPFPEARPGEPPPAVKEPPSLAPAPAPPKAAPAEKIKGVVFTRALIKIMDDQVNQPLFGWRPNTIAFGKLGLTDNVNNLQLGVLEVARRTIIVLNENLTRFAVTESHNPQVNEAMNFLMVSPDKYWFPSASGKYREAMQDLESYIEDLSLGRSRFYTRVDNLITLFSHFKDILGSCYYNLVKDTEAGGSPVSWLKADDYFYFSKGVALGMAEILEAVKEDFHQELQKKNTHKLLEDAIHALHEASRLNPWLITNGAKDGILANHRANMSTYIGEAEHLVATMQTVLATN
jgi:hypothetical protein